MKPIPYVYLPSMAAQEKLCRGLYALGYGRHNGSVEDAVNLWRRLVGKGNDSITHPYMTISPNAPHAWANRWDAFGGDSWIKERKDYTRVNSIAHFLAYVKAHGAAAQRVDV